MDRPARRDAIIATFLALVLGVVWTLRDWGNLQQLRLPDTDDMARLQQIRDWLAGQRFADLTQHRLAAGVPMHWSRLADLVPAALITLLTPVFGPHNAEVAAVIVSPLLLFAVALFLVARIARRLEPALAGTACAVAALAYPATTLFLPGRIDHHGLQMVLLLGAVLSLLRPTSFGGGAVAGLLAAASLTIGLETAPLLGIVGLVAVADWVLEREGAAVRLLGLGMGALSGLIAARSIFATSSWTYPACDGFTAQAWRAGVILGFALLLVVVTDRILLRWSSSPAPPSPVRAELVEARPSLGEARTPFDKLRTNGRGKRAVTTAAALTVAGATALLLSPTCIHPYGQVDPLLSRLWLSQVGEAQSLFTAPPAAAIGYAGLMLAGIAASAWRLRASRARGWAVLLAFQLAALAITIVQLRGAYAGALLATPGLAAAIGAARARGSLRLAAAWLASAGMLYPLAAQALTPARALPARGIGDCASPALLAALDRLPLGLVIAPIDAGASILAATRQRTLAAPYHRNDAGNLAAYRFYLGETEAAVAQANRWHASYWLSCAAMPGPARAAGLPGWQPAATLPDGAKIWARDGLSGTAARP